MYRPKLHYTIKGAVGLRDIAEFSFERVPAGDADAHEKAAR
jgi:hypothetical protein